MKKIMNTEILSGELKSCKKEVRKDSRPICMKRYTEKSLILTKAEAVAPFQGQIHPMCPVILLRKISKISKALEEQKV